MHAMETRTVARRIVRFSHDRKTRLYYAACVVLLVVAAGLRFHDLSEHSVWYDEALAANNSSGALSEVIPNTRCCNSTPILYPLALWAVQKVDVSAFNIRVLPATAGVLTVAVMLFLLPRLGVNRWAVFLAALPATLSVAAIEQARDAREYSIDALLAVLMIAGLLWYLRDGRRALLCVSLFLAPLLQYGLVLFGGAVMGAAILLPPRILAAREGNSYLSRIGHWFKQRVTLVWPAACFAAGCAISYAVTLRYQWMEGGWGSRHYLAAYYYRGKLDAQSIFKFSIDRTWSLLTYHLPEVVAIAALTALAVLLVAAFLRKFQGTFPESAVAVLFTLCIAVSVGAALLRIYPLGGIRQVIYLGPVIFLTVGVAIHWIADSPAMLRRRAWPARAPAVAAAGAIALAGADAMRQDSPYSKTDHNIKSVLAALEERVREEDMVFAVWWTVPPMRFYYGEEGKPDNYYYGTRLCTASAETSPCLREMIDLVSVLPNVPDRIFLLYDVISKLEESELLGEQVSVEHVTADDGEFRIALIGNIKASGALATRSDYEAVISGEPLIRSGFDVYFSENKLTYVKEPCASADMEAKFFLALYPADADDLPDHRRQYGFDNLDFYFYGRGLIFDGKCIARISLPEYAIARITTGQYVPAGVGLNNLWEGEMRLDDGVAPIVNAKESKKPLEAALRSDYETLVSGEPVMRPDFDVYLSENKLTYVKEPCVRADTEAKFFLALYPADANDLPGRRRQHGFDNLDFDFDERGVISDGKCVARIPLPDYAVTRIGTGQYIHAEGGFNHLWEEEIRLDE